VTNYYFTRHEVFPELSHLEWEQFPMSIKSIEEGMGFEFTVVFQDKDNREVVTFRPKQGDIFVAVLPAHLTKQFLNALNGSGAKLLRPNVHRTTHPDGSAEFRFLGLREIKEFLIIEEDFPIP